ncbi:MAG TPA: type IV pilus secretin PilQ, partial [Dissulfurispiraceae bacterium]|nr:type IV pilus secretin PilQ [Dissulfurispiraceae bacterium]
MKTRVVSAASAVTTVFGERRASSCLILSLTLVVFTALLWCGTCHAQGSTEITGIEVHDFELTVRASGPIIFQLHRPADPFRLVVDIQGARLGKFTKKIVSNKMGITEVAPVQIENPSTIARLDVLLQTPSPAKAEIRDGALVVSLEENAAKSKVTLASVSEAQAMPLRDGPSQSSSAATEIREVYFSDTPDGTELVIRGNGLLPEPSVYELDGRLIVDVPSVEMKAMIPSTAPQPVKKINYKREEGKIRFTLDLLEGTSKEVFVVDDELVVSLAGRKTVSGTTAEAPQVSAYKERLGSTTSSAGQKNGELISLDFQDADVVAILRLLSEVSGYNIVIHPDVKGKISMRLINVPWEQALDLILKTFNLAKSVDGNIIRVAPIAAFSRESDELAKAKESRMDAEILETRVFKVSYADAALVEKTIKDSKILTRRGNMSFDKRTSSLVINDVAFVFPKIESLLQTLDKPTPQVLIEARIVEITTNDLRDLGIQWGVTYKDSNTRFAIGGLSANPQLSQGPVSGNRFVVDFPANVSPLTGSGIAFGLLNAAGTLSLDVQISAIEQASKGRIISNPRVVTADNEKAKILQGESIPYAQRTSEGTVSAAFKDVAVKIEVTPHITPSDSIVLDVLTQKEDLVQFVDIGQGSQAPRTTKIEGTTKVLIQNGETLVIGGVYRRTERYSNTGTPWLKNIPILGHLFKRNTDQDDSNEVVIFIT